ncbi:MAG: FecR domain-containing protein [Spirochaetaceae bacterium]|nr:FecR domain-containing protein [Spirochaetaceae bacterium]
MKKHILVLALLFIGTFLFADITAVVKDISGKVEIKVPGGSWKKASAGMKIEEGYSISTGFRSTAVLALGASQVIVKQLTRMELTELVEKEGTVRTGLNLRVGKIKAHVRTTAGLRQNFRLTSPISTAAVRGTDFEYDGINLTVTEGTVVFTNVLGQGRSVQAGEISQILGTALPQSSEEINALLTSINPSTLTVPQDFDISKILDALNNLANVTIILNWGE